MILVLGFFAFHILFRRYVWPETYRKEGEEEVEGVVKATKKLKSPEKK